MPHCDAAGLTQHVSFHLGDSLPSFALERMQAEVGLLPETQRAKAKYQKIAQLQDTGFGSCLLAEPACAEILEKSLHFGDGSRYRLLSWVVMPNHVHVLIEQLPHWPLWKVVQGWKRHSAREIGKLLDVGLPSATRRSGSPSGPGRRLVVGKPTNSGIWQRDYWDRFIRDDEHLAAVIHYIEQNPVAAGLVGSAEQWRWGSAGLRVKHG